MLDYTGHPLVDVGIATIVAFADKDTPDEITESDLEAIADYMADNYVRNPLRSYLTVAFPNSGFTQPAFFTQPEKQALYSERVLRAFRAETPTQDEAGVFMGLPAAAVPFDVYGLLEPGRAFRQHIPLQTGESVINFHPYGEAGLPVSGLALLAVQAYPLGSAKCAGRTLSVHSDNPEIMRYFAAKFLKDNRAAVTLAQQAGSSKMPEPHLKYRTLLIQTLLDAVQRRQKSHCQEEPFSITAYHLSNSGQGADLTIYHLPSQIIAYLQLMLSPDYEAAWRQIVGRSWLRPKLKRGQAEAPPNFEPERNFLYEDLFRLAEDVTGQAPRFIRTYFLRDTLHFARNDPTDPRGQYSTRQEIQLVSWKLTEPFLRRIMHMDESRIKEIRSLGDTLAAYVKSQNDRRFFRNFYGESRYPNFRSLLIKANTEYVKRGNPPFLNLDAYMTVFEDGEELGKSNWNLARDLVLIRMIEKLYAGENWFQQNKDVFPETPESNTES